MEKPVKKSHIENAHYHHCDQCDEKFQEKHSLEAHIRRKHGRKRFNVISFGSDHGVSDTSIISCKLYIYISFFYQILT